MILVLLELVKHILVTGVVGRNVKKWLCVEWELRNVECGR